MKYSRHLKIFFDKFKRKKENKFDYIISLGYNCEVTYRFLKYFKFEDSGLFNWTYSYSINDLIYALNNFDKIAQGEFINPDPLWECKNTHIKFHGRENMGTYMNHLETDEILKKDLEDLKGRINHLKEKFLDILKNDKSKLYIYKIKKEDLKNDPEEKIKELNNALKNLGGNNFKLLIVYEKQDLIIPDNPNFITRNVEYFAPDNAVTDRKYLDNGWDNIYSEFYTNKIKSNKKKKYKFER
ncbi:MAG: hypothetical protein IJ877_01215 [Candidatus Gastranaerophilales bacterium]|nr:hypothetical protein [Candidatus Gastranaerophilales bacterium]